jgi:DNA-binding LytR/AlgR family response regulator
MIAKKILVVDDDIFIAEQLNAILTDLGYDVVGIATNSDMAIEIIKETPPDLALLDIRMHGLKQGFSIAKFLNEENQIPFIFITSFADKSTVEEASALKPLAYVLKPFNEQNIYSTLEIAFAALTKKKTHVTISSEQGKFNIAFKDILWVKVEDKYLEIQTINQNHLYRSTLSSLESQLDEHSFCRIHRSYVVNLNQIKLFKSNMVFIGEIEIPVSRTFLPDFKMKFEQI